MASKINNNFADNNVISAITAENFGTLPRDVQKTILDSIEKANQRDGGVLGRFFGNKKEIASMNIAAVICILLIAICGIDISHSILSDKELHMDLISTIIPVVSLSLGFIFGKGGKSE